MYINICRHIYMYIEGYIDMYGNIYIYIYKSMCMKNKSGYIDIELYRHVHINLSRNAYKYL